MFQIIKHNKIKQCELEWTSNQNNVERERERMNIFYNQKNASK
jgi:hypothetical protein